jgi:uncharacterized hydrophobic protein (TIGR00271 family)
VNETGLRERLERRLHISPLNKPQLYMRMYAAADISSLSYWIELLLSAAIATFGLVLNSPAVVIGAMLVSPLMGPILGAGLALAAADLYLGLRSIGTLVVSIAAAIVFSGLVVWALPFHAPTAEILARTQPNLLDLGVAVFSGLAGALIVTRPNADGVTALPGVAIAVALMPPLCTIGFGVGSGFDKAIMSGAALLFLTNLVAIVGSAFLVFFLVRMDSPEIKDQIAGSIREAGREERLYRILESTGVHNALGEIGKLRWRVLMIVVLLGAIIVPLRTALTQVRDELVAREAVTSAIRALAPRDATISQQVDTGARTINVSLLVARPVPPAKIAEAEKEITRRTGKEVRVTVQRVASEEELSSLRERIRLSPVSPAPLPVGAAGKEIISRLGTVLAEFWPSEVELEDFELAFGKGRSAVRIRYRAPAPLDEPAKEMITRLLRKQMDAPDVNVEFEYDPPAPLRTPAVKRR